MEKIKMLNRLLSISDKEIKELDLEQLQIMLGVFRYVVRVLEREVNEREKQELGKDIS